MPATTHLWDLLTIFFMRKTMGDYNLNELRSVRQADVASLR